MEFALIFQVRCFWIFIYSPVSAKYPMFCNNKKKNDCKLFGQHIELSVGLVIETYKIRLWNESG